ncbi:MAG: hypothetical protein KF809_18160 [Chloroflexi bacterium]|nr:hypothetical protein [Chloroflexota bacterium]
MLTPRDPARRPRLVERPLDIVALELLVTISQALLAGILLAWAHALGGDTRSVGLPVPGLLAVLGIAALVAWGLWLAGITGLPMLALGAATAVLTGALWLLALGDGSLPRIDPLAGLVAFSCAILAIVAGAFLPGPRRDHWKGGPSRPHRGLPETRTTPARFSPAVQKVVDERLTPLPRPHLPRIALPHRAHPGIGTDEQPIAVGQDPTTLDAPAAAPAAAPDVTPATSGAIDATAAVSAMRPPVTTQSAGRPPTERHVRARDLDDGPTEAHRASAAEPPSVDDAPTEALSMPLGLDEAPTEAIPHALDPADAPTVALPRHPDDAPTIALPRDATSGPGPGDDRSA